MNDNLSSGRIRIELGSEKRGHCDCCGRESRLLVGLLFVDEEPTASYFLHWTYGHLEEMGADLDIVYGLWGDGATPNDRILVSLRYRRQANGPSGFMVVDARERPRNDGVLAAYALRREEVIGTPLARVIFALADAILDQDKRFS